MTRLRERVAVVTGAASGLGRALSRELARHGCHLALVDIDAPALQDLADSLRRQGHTVSHHVADVADVDRMRSVVDEVQQAHHDVHLLINNAGVTSLTPFALQSLEQLRRIVDVNLGGTLNGCTLFLPLLARQDEARILNISSMAAFGGFPLQAAYCASKAAVHRLSEVLTAELRHTPIRVTCALPGPIRTGIVGSAPSSDPALKQRLTAGVDARGAEPDHVARIIIRAVRRNRARVVIGGYARLWEWAMRFMPGLTQRAMARQFRSEVMR